MSVKRPTGTHRLWYRHHIHPGTNNWLRPEQIGRYLADHNFTANFYILIRISMTFIPNGPTLNMLSLVHVMEWCRQVPSHYLNQFWPGSMAVLQRITIRQKIRFEIWVILACSRSFWLTTYMCPSRGQLLVQIMGRHINDSVTTTFLWQWETVNCKPQKTFDGKETVYLLSTACSRYHLSCRCFGVIKMGILVMCYPALLARQVANGVLTERILFILWSV